MDNFLDHFFALADKLPDRAAMVDQDGSRVTTYAEMKDMIGKVTAKLLSLGLAEESFILINMTRRTEYVAAYCGIIAAGLATVPTLIDYPEERIRYIRENSESPYTVTDDFFDDLDRYEPVFRTDIRPDAIVCMNYTSGSTGNPKGVYYSMRCVSEGIMRTMMMFDGIDGPDGLVTAASASLSFAAMCVDCLSPLARGATVHLLSDEVRKDVVLMMQYYKDHSICCGNVSPGMLKYFRHTPGLKRVFSTGERVVNAYSELHEIWCVYGLTEAYTAVCYFPIDKKYNNTPIGKAFGDVRLDILDEDGNEVPDGTEGEIFVTGYLAEGYYKMPEKTEECFTDYGSGLKRFATHDIGYKDENGNIVYVDRKDWMVKINGQRVELFEVEAVLNEIPAVKKGVVKCFQDNGPAYLCAYYTTDDESLTGEDIRRELGKKLPSYMIPAFTIKIDAFPLTVSGKTDRKALKAPEHSDFLTEYAPPETREEALVCNAMQKALQVDKVGRNDDFFLLGGDSLAVIELMTIIGSDSLRASDIVEGRTPAGIAKFMSGRDILDISGDEACRRKSYPLTAYQKHYYQYWKFAGTITMGNTPMLLAFSKDKVSAEDLADTALAILKNHPAYSTYIYEDESGEPMQKFDPSLIEKPEIIECTDEEFDRLKEGLIRPFALKERKLYTWEVYNTEDKIYLFMDAHHIISDAGSQDIIINELSSVIEGSPQLNPDYYCTWLDRITNASADTQYVIMPDDSYDKHPSFDKTAKGILTNVIRVQLPCSMESFHNQAKSYGATPLEFLIAAALRSVAEYNGSYKAAVNWIYSGRDMKIKQNIAGLLLSSMPVPVDFTEDSARKDLISEIKKINQNNSLYSDLSAGNSGMRPVVDDTITVNYIPYEGTSVQHSNRDFEAVSLIDNNTARTNVFYIIAPEPAPDSRMTLLFRYNSESYEQSSAERFVEMFMNNLGLEGD